MARARRVQLSITGTQYPPAEDMKELAPGERDRLAVVTETRVEAVYYREDESHFFLYSEQPDGAETVVRSRIKCGAGFLELVRHGGMESRMVFEPGKRNRTEYPTPYGMLLLDVLTERVELEMSEDGCPRVTVDYVLENAGQPMGSYRLEIRAIKLL